MSRSVKGIVTDAHGKPVQGAVVKLQDMETLSVRSYITSQDGAYHFDGLSTRISYELRAEYKGRESSVERLSRFDTRKTAVIDLKLPV